MLFRQERFTSPSWSDDSPPAQQAAVDQAVTSAVESETYPFHSYSIIRKPWGIFKHVFQRRLKTPPATDVSQPACFWLSPLASEPGPCCRALLLSIAQRSELRTNSEMTSSQLLLRLLAVGVWVFDRSGSADAVDVTAQGFEELFRAGAFEGFQGMEAQVCFYCFDFYLFHLAVRSLFTVNFD